MIKILTLLLFSAFTSCGEKAPAPVVEPQIEVEPTDLKFTYKASSLEINVTCNTEWSISSSDDWVSFSPSQGGAGTAVVKVSVDENKGASERTSSFSVKAGTFKRGCTLIQYYNYGDIPTPDGYTLVWHDEFDEPRQSDGSPSLPDEDEWRYETGASGWGNNEIQNYIAGFRDADTCAQVYDGTLKIIAKKVGSEILSIRMNTKQGWTYGYFQARLKLPSGKGTWPAFWMLPVDFKAWPDDGEIDIMEEVGYHPDYVSSSVHCKAYNHSIGTHKTKEIYLEGAQSEFHIYALEWTSEYIKTYVDGNLLFTFFNDKTGNKDTWPFNVSFYLKLNLAWGGDWGGAQGVDESCLPATYEVDYVRVFTKL